MTGLADTEEIRPHFMEFAGLLPLSQESNTDPYLKSNEPLSKPNSSWSILILLSHLFFDLPSSLFPSALYLQFCSKYIFISLILAACTVHLLVFVSQS
jgi:hypothetical protein